MKLRAKEMENYKGLVGYLVTDNVIRLTECANWHLSKLGS